MIPLAVGDLLETLDRLLQGRNFTRLARERLGNNERLREKPLHPPGAMHDELVFLRQLVHPEDRNNVLEFAVSLERRLHPASARVVPCSDVLRIEHAAARSQRIDGRVDAFLADRTLQVDERVELAERRRRRRVRRIVRRDVDRLDRGDRPLGGRRDPLLKRAHLRGERRLVADRRGHPAQQRGDLAPRLREAEDIVDEQQHVGAGRVAEVLRHGQRREGHAEPRARRLVHLAEDHARLLENRPAVGHLRLLHLQPEIVPLAGPLPDAGKHRIPPVLAGDPRNQLGQDHRLAEPGAAEQPRFAAPDKRRQQVDHLDAGLEHFGFRRKLRDLGRVAMDRPALRRFHRAPAVHRVAEKVEDAAERGLADRHGNRGARVNAFGSAHQTIGAPKGHAAHPAAPEVLLHFPRQLEADSLVRAGDLHRVVDRRQSVLGVFHVERGADHLGNAADIGSLGCAGSCRHGGLWVFALARADFPRGETRWVTCSALRRR